MYACAPDAGRSYAMVSLFAGAFLPGKQTRLYRPPPFLRDAEQYRDEMAALLTATPCVAKLPSQEQGEAIAISRETPPYLFLLSEDVGEPIWKIPLTNSARSPSPEAATAPPPVPK